MSETTAASSLEYSPHIRSLDVTRDLNPVADLIEQCFPIQQDRDGQTYLRQMRTVARDMRYLRWVSSMADLNGDRVTGFVWEEDDRIIGNISLVPFTKDGRKIHMIANVAVEPGHRRRGIARALTVRALNYLRRRGEPAAWLQVKTDNLAAQALYRSLGFLDVVVRTTWRIRPTDAVKMDSPGNLRLRKPAKSEWPQQKALLDAAYPVIMRWNLPMKFQWLEPDPLQTLAQWAEGIRLRRWAVALSGETLGWIAWQKSNSFANNLWLAFPEQSEDAYLAPALQAVMAKLSPRHPLSIDYPVGRFQGGFERLGFTLFRTLIWMRCKL